MSKKLQIVGAIKTPQADFNQTDETKSDFIKNKPNFNDYITNEKLASALNMTEDICYMDAGSIAEEGDDTDG